MGIFPDLSRFFRKREAPAPLPVKKEVVRPKKTATLVFVDMSNLYRREPKRRRVRWHNIRLKIEEIVGNSERRFAQAYYETRALQQLDHLDEVRKGFEKAGYRFEKYQKSVDVLIASDMWREMLEAIASREYETIRIVIASGDGDYTRPLEDIADRIKDPKVEIVVLSWKENIKPRLQGLATRFELIDELPNINKEKNLAADLA